jgi:transcriptional regulator with XRE-family HTH domain
VSTQSSSVLSQAREKLGFEPEALASALGISKASYYDLESHRSELFQNLSLRRVLLLSRLLKVPLPAMFSETPSGSPGRLMDLAARVALHCSETGLSVEQFGERVGWDIQQFVTAPATALDDWCVDTLRAVCRGVRCSWIDVLTNEAAA